MTSNDSCSLCCRRCRSRGINPSTSESINQDPYALPNLLPIGTIQLATSCPDILFCAHTHCSDGWHAFNKDTLSPFLAPEKTGPLCHQLDFLIKYKFLFVSYMIDGNATALYLRLYIIPYDLPNAQGKLRTRDEALILKPAREYMKSVLPLVIQHRGSWFADSAATSESPRRIYKHKDPVNMHIFSPRCYLILSLLYSGQPHAASNLRRSSVSSSLWYAVP